MSGPSPTRARILDAALGLFATRGYDATSVREICEAAGITKPTLYHFFGNKEGVFLAMAGGTIQGVQDELEAALRAGAAFEDQLRHVVRFAFDAARKQPTLWRFIYGTVWAATRAPVAEMHRRYEQVTAVLQRALEEGVARGEIAPGPTPVRLLVIMGAVSEALSSYLILGRPDLSNDLADALVETLVSGWRASRPADPSGAAVSGGHAPGRRA